MGRKLRSIWKLLALAGLLASLMAIPAVGQEGAPADGDIIRLHLGTDGKYFRHSDPAIADQKIPQPRRCALDNKVAGPLASLTANQNGPGLFGLSIGVKTGNAAGVPCGRVDRKERLTLTLGEGYLAERASFDLELKGNAEIEIKLSNGETFIVRSGKKVVPGQGVDATPKVPHTVTLTSSNQIGNCSDRADSGPDSGANDNCYVTVVPSSTFSGVTFAPKSGEMSLEGSGDYANNPDFDTIFYLETWDGELDCGDEETRVDGDVSGTIMRHDNWDGEECVLKPFRLAANADDGGVPTGESVTFEIAADGQNAAYTAFLTFPGELKNPTQLELNWSTEPPFDSFTLMQPCEEDPFDEEGAPNLGALPEDEEGCIISVFQDFTGQVTWHVFFIADPKFY